MSDRLSRSLALSLVFSFASLFAVACGSSPGATDDAQAAATAGGEGRAEVPAEPPSFLPADARVVVRVDLARVRRSPVAADVESALVATTMWQELAGGTGIRPVEHVDALLVGADDVYADRRVAVVRYPGTEAWARERLLAASVARSIPLAFREESGFSVTPLPVALRVPHSLVFTAPHELVIAPSDDVERVIAIARDHAARRAAAGAADAIVEPQLTFAEGEVLSVLSSAPLPGRAGYPTPPSSYRVHAMEDGASHHVFAYVHGEFETEADAQAALDWALANARRYASEFIVRGAGLSRPLEALTGRREGAVVDVQTDLSADEVRRFLGAMALLQTLAEANAR